ncbi:hypothetical protein E2C01_049351 [Portunus trituberculatus]|uniref:Uncharacterized protein n=1 Tax=Portunus trituberculatus TaxID=210409 RepID=A0A5B7GCX2_PORTR|nr:hypothetical protein [Portunus trituberculatus]
MEEKNWVSLFGIFKITLSFGERGEDRIRTHLILSHGLGLSLGLGFEYRRQTERGGDSSITKLHRRRNPIKALVIGPERWGAAILSYTCFPNTTTTTTTSYTITKNHLFPLIVA